jgi:hypothetical protein
MKVEDKMNESGGEAIELEDTLKDFRLSVHAWSAAELSSPRTVAATAGRRQIWRLATAWAFTCVLVAGSVSTGVYRHHRLGTKITVAQKAVQGQQVLGQAVQQAAPVAPAAGRAVQADEDLLAKVDIDVSRQVPRAMEPLAQLMSEDETQ